MRRRKFLSRVGVLACGAALGTSRVDRSIAADRDTENSFEDRLSRAANWLWQQQGDDGGWHSATYALLRSGQALTPFLLDALLEVPERCATPPAGAIEMAVAFIERHVIDDGALGLADPDITEYPNYATADALRALTRLNRPDTRGLCERMLRYLVGQQFSEESGFIVTDDAYGGWGFGGKRPPGDPGHMDLAHTSRVLHALAAAGCHDEVVYRRVQIFLRFVQKYPEFGKQQPSLTPFPQDEVLPVPCDGGFYFSPVVLAANKGRETTENAERPYFRSYATATCDGVLALLAAGVDPADERVQRAHQWLLDHPQLDHPAGIPLDHPEPWGAAVHFYHLAGRAEVYTRLTGPDGWRDALLAQLATEQAADGSFRNRRSGLMKEDDPLLATGLAVSALAAISSAAVRS
jgi:hypothetical protein